MWAQSDSTGYDDKGRYVMSNHVGECWEKFDQCWMEGDMMKGVVILVA